jgi:hypothetical protein
LTVEVYTEPGEPAILRQMNEALVREQSPGYGRAGGGIGFVNTTKLAQAAFAEAADTARAGNTFFGPFPEKRIAITQQSAWSSDQSWPTLIDLPYVAFASSTTRNRMGFGLDTSQFVDEAGTHEIAHQWWGHEVGWNSYHDVWLSEGFAEFTSGLVLQLRKGDGGYNDFWERKRTMILGKPGGARITKDQAGPITQGIRLATWQDPQAYGALVYGKGAYVLHMLRMLMKDQSKPNPDAAFQDMMKDFVTTWAGKNPSTADFQQIVEKHATHKLKLTKDGKLDWFFDQWVRGTAIPRYTTQLEIRPAAGGKYRLSGSITQSEVPEDFAVAVPIYVNLDGDSFAKVGDVLLIGSSTMKIDVEVMLPRRPRGVAINLMHDVLAR